MSLQNAAKAHKGKMDDLLKRRFFFAPAFEVYGGEKGLFDLGPVGCGVKSNLLAIWRQHFIVEDNMLEVETTSLTPLPVLKASGHLERFKDVMVRDMQTGECFRADHLLEDTMKTRLQEAGLSADLRTAYEVALDEAGTYNAAKLKEVFTRLKVASPNPGNTLADPEDFNMMFETALGPRAGALAEAAGTRVNTAFLRPETAQGIFLCFPRLYEYNGSKLPFSACQIGPAFRNEIAPRNQLLRVREFTMAEIEHFLDPEDKSHPKFASVKDVLLPLFPRDEQKPGAAAVMRPIGAAVQSGMVNNETLGYFLVRIYTFLTRIGIKPQGIRFRQHRADEMAHYACDCWDAEIETSYGWVECVGCADRSAYDLTAHAGATGRNLSAQKTLPEPIVESVLEVQPEKKTLGPKFKSAPKGTLQILFDNLAKMSNEEAKCLQAAVAAGGASMEIEGVKYPITADMVSFKEVQRKTSVRTFFPSVIEPSFGIGRILYALFEHSFGVRESADTRGWMALLPSVAPVKCCVVPLLTNAPAKFTPIMFSIAETLTSEGLANRIDDSSTSVGKKYARFDEIGVPFAVTVDVQSTQEAEAARPVTVTLRDRNSMQQVRLPLADVAPVLVALSDMSRDWASVVTQYGLVAAAAAAE